MHITDAQAGPWNDFAQTMRDNAKHAVPQSKPASATAVDNLQARQRSAEARAEKAKKLTASFERLYAALSDEQKKAADVAFKKHRNRRPAPQKAP
ncbi:MAG: Spy/CpxP family protein refolding chaperone [Alphaproteobacteria bacterium]|nr:Spy/CpxP family protein refolding chaperone [Alphaproteobacteria bacterium]